MRKPRCQAGLLGHTQLNQFDSEFSAFKLLCFAVSLPTHVNTHAVSPKICLNWCGLVRRRCRPGQHQVNSAHAGEDLRTLSHARRAARAWDTGISSHDRQWRVLR